jgi:hypothetical protein
LELYAGVGSCRKRSKAYWRGIRIRTITGVIIPIPHRPFWLGLEKEVIVYLQSDSYYVCFIKVLKYQSQVKGF